MVKETEQYAYLPATVRLGGSTIDRSVLSGIRAASDRTGVDFTFMLAKARHESGFQTDARNRRSTAQGLYQFTDQTWMEQIKRHGAKYGLSHLADRLTRRAEGGYQADSPDAHREILALRRDPAVSAAMAAEYTRGNSRYLERHLGRPASETDLYMAHFLGPGGAVNFLRAMDHTPAASAADAFPRAAGANRTIFYTSGGEPRSFSQVYEIMEQSISSAMSRFGPSAAPPLAHTAVYSPASAALPHLPGGLDGDCPDPVPVAPVMPRSVRDRRTIADVVGRYREMMQVRDSGGAAVSGPREDMGRDAVALYPVPVDRKPALSPYSRLAGGVPLSPGSGALPRPVASRPAAEDMGGARLFADRGGLPWPVASRPGPEDMALSRDPDRLPTSVRPAGPAGGLRLELASSADGGRARSRVMASAVMPSTRVMDTLGAHYARLVGDGEDDGLRALANQGPSGDTGAVQSALNTRPGDAARPTVLALEETFRPEARVTEVRRRFPPVVSQQALGRLSKEERHALFGQVVERPVPPEASPAVLASGEGASSPESGVMAWIRRIRG